MICHWYPEPIFFFFAPDLPELLFYSHFPALVIALAVGLFVLLSNKSALLNKILFLIILCFSFWVLINLIAWTHINSQTILFTWSFFGALQGLIAILSIYFVHVYVTKTDISKKLKGALLLLIVPVLLLAATDLNISGFDLDWCDAFPYEGVAFLTYYSFLGIVAVVWIGYVLIKHIFNSNNKSEKQKSVLLLFGIEFFLLLFFVMVYVGSITAISDFFESSQIEFYGLFGMTIFMVLIGVLTVKFKAFNASVHAAEALTIALIILIASQYTYTNSTTSTIVLTTITLILTTVAGIYLNRSVRKEIKQREEIEELAKKLAKANKRLRKLDKAKSEFVSIASHQLRSPLTAMRGYASMLLEGSYGKLPETARDVIQRIAESSKNMAVSVEDYLNVSRIESGNMKYELIDFNIADEASRVVDDTRQEAIKSGLLLTYKSDLKRNGIVNADRGKVAQILHNLINNSIKYTQNGSITVYVSEDTKSNMIHIDIKDTGVGMSTEELDNIFGKFERAPGANAVNVSGTGLGLFVAKSMAEHMGGSITAFSDGKGLGSTFRISFPLAA